MAIEFKDYSLPAQYNIKKLKKEIRALGTYEGSNLHESLGVTSLRVYKTSTFSAQDDTAIGNVLSAHDHTALTERQAIEQKLSEHEAKSVLVETILGASPTQVENWVENNFPSLTAPERDKLAIVALVAQKALLRTL